MSAILVQAVAGPASLQVNVPGFDNKPGVIKVAGNILQLHDKLVDRVNLASTSQVIISQ